MSTLTYNGVNLQIVKTRHFSRQPIYNGPDYLYTRYRIAVRAVYNLAATSYDSRFLQDNEATERRGYSATHTDVSIRHVLMTPRKKLLFTSGWYDQNGQVVRDAQGGIIRGLLNLLGGARPRRDDRVIVESPPPSRLTAGRFYNVDANNGPMPLACDVVAIDGTLTFKVEFVIQTDINESFLFNSGTPPVLLSNRWKMSMDIDRDHFTTRHVQGTAIFRTDRMLDLTAGPDNFRQALGHPVPAGFRRERINVSVDEANNALRYSFVDREMSHNLLTRLGVTRVECFMTLGQSLPGKEDKFWAGVQAGGALWNQNFGQAVGAAQKFLPSGSATLVARAWGNRLAARVNLADVVTRMLLAKIPDLKDLNPKEVLFTTNSQWTFDCVGRFAEGRVQIVSGPITTAILLGTSSWREKYPKINSDNLADEVGTIADSLPRTDTGSIGNRGNTAGTYLKRIVAQALSTENDSPADPPIVLDERDLNVQ